MITRVQRICSRGRNASGCRFLPKTIQCRIFVKKSEKVLLVQKKLLPLQSALEKRADFLEFIDNIERAREVKKKETEKSYQE